MTRKFDLQDVECRYGPRTALRLNRIALHAGELTAIVGPNGAGKSTLIKTLAGLLAPAEGDVRLDGVALDRFADRERARRIAYLPADSRLAWPMIARRVVELGRYPFLKPLTRPSDEDDRAVEDAMERAGATGLADRRFDELSSGEKARILLARALATRAGTLLLDEPGAALDPRHQLAVMNVLRAEANRGVCTVFAGHSLELVSASADRVLVVCNGGIIADGTPAEALSPAILRDVFGLDAPRGIRPPEWTLV
jgi:iron complex transport system ATP-binding protein